MVIEQAVSLCLSLSLSHIKHHLLPRLLCRGVRSDSGQEVRGDGGQTDGQTGPDNPLVSVEGGHTLPQPTTREIDGDNTATTELLCRMKFGSHTHTDTHT